MTGLVSHVLKPRFHLSRAFTTSCSRWDFGLVKPAVFSDHVEPAPDTQPSEPARTEKPVSDEDLRRKRKTEWKRQQRGESFLDHVIINVRGGRGGDGCVAFHREKFQQYGPPAGGNGGRGGDVYILPSAHLTTLSSVPKRVRAEAGASGSGTWQNGQNAAPFVIRVPVGTIVRELTTGDTRRAQDEWEAEDERLEELPVEERRDARRARRFLHFPRYATENEKRSEFRALEVAQYHEERQARAARRAREREPLQFDLDVAEEAEVDPNAPLGLPRRAQLGHLIASGGKGGLGNPHFLTTTTRSPKFATRGWDGERVTLELELKLLADVGLVGIPNAGKSTLLRALTGGRARTEVAGYAFTTLNPSVAVVRVAEDGAFEGERRGALVQDETLLEEEREHALMDSGAYADAPTRNQALASDTDGDGKHGIGAGHFFDLDESFRFTIADNPGLIERASENVGLGHSFLRSIERSLALVYVVDLSGDAPWDELRVLRDELEKYKPGMSALARLVVANKADLLVGDAGDPEAVQAAREKLARLEECAKAGGVQEGAEAVRPLEVVPVSAKFSQNLRKVVALMKQYVEEERAKAAAVESSVE